LKLNCIFIFESIARNYKC